LDIQCEETKYESESLRKIFINEFSYNSEIDDINYSLFISAIIRTLFQPYKKYDYDLVQMADSISEVKDNRFGIFTHIKKIIRILVQTLNNDQRGFSYAALSHCKDKSVRQTELFKISDEANKVRDNFGVIIKINPNYTKMLRDCFGPKSHFFNGMDIVINNAISQKEQVKDLISQFCDNENNISSLKIEKFVDVTWNNYRERNSWKISGDARGNFIKSIKDRLNILLNWLLLIDSENNVNIDVNDFENKRQELKGSLEEIIQIINNGNITSPQHILLQMLNRIYNIINLQEDFTDKWFYKEFLLTNNIELDNNLVPILNNVKNFDPWQRVIVHIISPHCSFEEALQNHINLDNYGYALHIINYLSSLNQNCLYTEDQLMKLINQVKNEYKIKYESFKSEFELAFMYGQVEELRKEEIIKLSEDFLNLFYEKFDFGLGEKFLSILKDLLNKEIAKKYKYYIKEAQRLSTGKDLNLYPIIRDIDTMIKNKNFTVAEEYLQLLREGNKQVDLSGSNETDYHNLFLEEYNSIFNRCMKYNGSDLKKYTMKEVSIIKEKYRENNLKLAARDLESMQNLINSWPNDLSSAQNKVSFVGTLFTELNFTILKCTPNEKNGKLEDVRCSVADLYIKPQERNLNDYAHPIDIFGTNISDKITVISLFGGLGAKEIIDTLTNKLHFEGTTIVLLDTHLSLQDRRTLAQAFKTKTSWQHPFVVIDRVLLLFLASFLKADRLEAFLKCTLPYTYCQPYNSSGTGGIADEMFFGRKREINALLDMNGKNLVYGGRQLGKTALLHRIQSIANKPEDKSFAIFIDASPCIKSEQLLERIVIQLTEMKIINGNPNTWEKLRMAIEGSFNREKFEKLYLLIDEADDFIKDDMSHGYLSLKELRILKDNLKNKFKFVLAGLHNFSRLLKHEDNGSLAQFGEPVCIKPMSPYDASRLLKKPLLYIGYKFEKEDQQLPMILSRLNYYPGLLHLFCSKLIDTATHNYDEYFRIPTNPPYILTEQILRDIIQKNDMTDEINKKFMLTLHLDKRYLKIAQCLAYFYEEYPNQEGYSPQMVKQLCDEWEVKSLYKQDVNFVNNLMKEMDELGVFSVVTNDIQIENIKYIFRKYSFYKAVLGNTEDMLEKIIEDE
jgi:hypothetical protein